MHSALMQQDFNGKPLGLIPHDGDLWVQAEDIGGCLEYAEGRKAIMKIYERSREELDPHTCVVKLTTQGQDGTVQRRDVRVFNEEGVMIITMLSRQPIAAEFRAWAVKILKAYRRGELAMSAPAGRDHLLELCITEAGKGNVAALDTLVKRYGYPGEIKVQQLKLVSMRYGKGNPLIAQEAPPLFGWFADKFLPELKKELLIGETGHMAAALEEAGLLIDGSLEFQTSTLLLALYKVADQEGVDTDVTPRAFGEWMTRGEDRILAAGWTRRLSKTTHGVKIYRLEMLFPRLQ